MGFAFSDLATKIGVSTTALAGFAGTAVGLIATFALLDLAFTSAAEATENYNNASKAYDEAKEKVKGINTELQTTQSRIDELNAKESLTFVEQEELNKLKEATEELRVQAELAKEEEKRKARELAEAAVDAYNANYIYDISKEATEKSYNSQKGNTIGNAYEQDISSQLAKLKIFQEYKEQALALGDASSAENYSAFIQETEDSIWKQVQILEDYKTKLSALSAEELGIEGSEVLAEITTDIEYIWNLLKPGAWKQMQFDSIFDTAYFAKVKEELIALAQKAEDTGITIADIPQTLKYAVEAEGFSVYDIVDQINSEAGILKIDEVRNQLANAFSTSIYNDDVMAGLFPQWISEKTDDELRKLYEFYTSMSADALKNMNFNDWQAVLDDVDAKVEVDAELSPESVSALEKQIEKLDFKKSVIDDNISAKEADGRLVDEADYQRQIDVSQASQATLDSLIRAKVADYYASDDAEEKEEIAAEIRQLRSDLNEERAYEKEAKQNQEAVPKQRLENQFKLLETAGETLNRQLENVGKMSTEEQRALYQELIKNSKDKSYNLSNQYDIDKAKLSGFDVTDPGYIELTESMESTAAAIEANTENQIAWRKAMNEIDLVGLQENLSAKALEGTRLQNAISDAELRGVKTDELDYLSLIQNGSEQLNILEDQEKELNKLIDIYSDLYGENSEEVKDYKDQLLDVQDSMRDLRNSQYEWNQSIRNLPLMDMANLSSALSSVFSEINSATGITTETVDALRVQFSDLANMDISDVFYRSAKGLKVDTDALQEFVEKQYQATHTDFEQKIAEQEQAIEDYQKTIGKGGSLETLREMEAQLIDLQNRQVEYYAKYQEQMKQFSQYNAIQIAKNTANAGDEYVSMLSEVETALESYNKGLVGTDDFKSVAAYLSPNGFEDAGSFEESYQKANRYLKDTSEGVKNFLNDLETKGLAEFNEETELWTYNIANMKKAAQEMGIGEEFMTAMFGRLEDYGFTNMFVSSIEEGKYKTEELAKELAEARIKYAELQAQGADTKTLASQQSVIDNIVAQYDGIQDAVSTFSVESAKDFVEGFKNAKEQIQLLKGFAENASSDLERKYYEDAAKSLAETYGFEISPDLVINEESYNAIREQLALGDWEIPLTAVDMGYKEGTKEAQLYLDTQTAIREAYADNKDALSELSQYTASQLKEIALGDGTYNVKGLEGAEDILEKVASAAGYSAEEIDILIDSLVGLGIVQPDVDIEKFKALTDEVSKATDELTALQESGVISEGINLEFNIDEFNTVDEIQSKIAELTEERKYISLSTDEGQRAVKALDIMINALEDKQLTVSIAESGMSVDQLLELAETDSSLFAKTLNIDSTQVDETKEKLIDLKETAAEATMTVRLDESQFSQLVPTEEKTVTVDYKLGSQEKPKAETAKLMYEKAGQEHAEPENVDLIYQPVYDEVTASTPPEKRPNAIYTPVYDELTSSIPPEKRPMAIYQPDYSEVTNSIPPTKETDVDYVPDYTRVTDSIPPTKETDVDYVPDYERVTSSAPPEKESTVTFQPITDAVIEWKAPEKASWVEYFVDSTNIYNWTPPRKTGYIDYVASGAPKASGTMTSIASHANGTLGYNAPINTTPISTSYAKGGQVSLKHDEVALVNELPKPESIIRDGVWSMLPPGMHMEHLRRGDIIINGEQTEQLLKYGRASGHARAYANGTLPDGYISAYAGGTTIGGGFGGFQGGAAGNTIGSTASTSNKVTKYAQQASSAVAKAAETVENVMDWIQIAIEESVEKTDRFIRTAENSAKLSTALNYYQKAIDNINDTIARNEAGAIRYQKQANAVGLSTDLAKKVQDGTIDINEYSEDTKKKIDEYKQWYDQVEACTLAVEELKIQQKELAQTKLDTIIDKYDLRISQQDAYLDRYDAQLSYRETAGYSDTATKQKDLYTAAIKQENDKVAYFQKAATALFNEMQSQLSSGLMTEGDDRWREVQNQLQEYNISLYESKTAIEEWNQSLRDMQANKLRDALGRFERYADQLADIVSLRQSRDTNITESVYKKQLTANNNQIYYQDKLLSEYLEEQALYEYGSEKWNEYAEKIADCKSAVLGLLTANEELKDSIVEERWETFTKLQEQVDASITEIDYLRDALNDSVNTAGDLTSDGQANIALIGKAITLENQTIADYTKALQKLEKDLKKGNISQVEYNEKQNEFLSIIRDSASAVSDYREELIDLYKEQIEAKNDVLIDNIDMYQKAYESQKEYFDYGENLKEQTKTLDVLNAQISALEGITNASGRARLAQLKAQRQEAQDDLDKTKRDHEYELKVTGFDTLKENIQSQLEAVQNELEISSTMQQTVVDLMLMNIETGYADAYSTIQSTISNTGVIMSDMTSEAINGWNNVANAIKLAGQAMSEISSYDPSKVASDIKTSTIVTNQTSKEDSNGNKITTTTAEKNATTASSVKNNAGTKESSTMSVLTKATKLKLNKTSLSLTVGKTGKLTVTSTPENASTSYTWSSSNAKIATVSGGSVTAVKKGSATITVKDSTSGKTATCKVTVKAKTTTSSSSSASSGTSSTTSNSTSSSQNVWKNIAVDKSDKGNSRLDKDVSIVDRMKYFGYASDKTARTQLFKNLGGSGTYTSSATQNAWLLQQLKKAGYHDGGIVGYNPITKIFNKAARATGDDGITILKAGETVMPMKFTELLPQGLKILEEVGKVNVHTLDATKQPIVINTEFNMNIDHVNEEVDLQSALKKFQNDFTQHIVSELHKKRGR